MNQKYINRINKLPQDAISFILSEYQKEHLASYEIARITNRLFNTSVSNDMIPMIIDLNGLPRRGRSTVNKIIKRICYGTK